MVRNHCRESQKTPPHSPVPSSASSMSSSNSVVPPCHSNQSNTINQPKFNSHNQDSNSIQAALHSPTALKTNSPSDQLQGYKYGTPRPARLSVENAPVHIDVGGCIYTSSLETLTKFNDSRLSKMFNGTIPIVLDTLKQHYFIDRDGKAFRYVLNFMRTGRLSLPVNFDDFETLIEEAKYYQLAEMVKQLETKSGTSSKSSESTNKLHESNLSKKHFY